MKKRLVNILAAGAVFAVIIIAVLLCGCAQKDGYEKCAEEFFNALQARDYDAIYDMMTPSSQSSISREKLKEYYDKVYSALEVTGIEASEFERVNQDRDAVFNYSLKLVSQKCGELSFDSSVTVRALLGFYLVEWTPGNVVPGMDYYDTVQVRTLRGIRGEIFDSSGAVLVKNAYAVTVYFNLNKTADFAASAQALAGILDLDADELVQSMTKAAAGGNDTVVAAVYVPGALEAEKEERALAVDGVRVDRSSITPIRQAVYGSAAAHLIGYSTPVTKEDRSNEKYAGLSEGTRVGRIGAEYVYDDILRGTDGVEIALRSADGSRRTVLYRKEATAGQDVVLTIDIRLQLEAERLMQEQYSRNKSTGAVIVNDPKSGKIKAMASYPNYDPNLFVIGMTPEQAAKRNSCETNGGEQGITIVLLNNNGGAIFDMLPQKSQEAYFERLFLTPQDVDFQAAVAAFGVPCSKTATLAEFDRAYRASLDVPGISFIEVPVPLQGLRERYADYW